MTTENRFAGGSGAHRSRPTQPDAQHPVQSGRCWSMRDESVGEWLRRINASERLAEAHRPYFDIAMVGDDDFHPGANWVAWRDCARGQQPPEFRPSTENHR